jgi:DNA invertase Pin-like site-specific DNA recombinase
MVAYGYCRVSTYHQVTDGDSLNVQQRQIEGYAKMHALDLRNIFVEEGVTGAMPAYDRPVAKTMLYNLRRGDHIIVAKLDRLFRSTQDALFVMEQMKHLGVHLHMMDLGGDVTANGLSKLFMTIVAAFAETERDRIVDRVLVTKAAHRAQGRYLGGTPPFGYVLINGHTLREQPWRKAMIEHMVRRMREGLGYRRIAAEVRQMGHPCGFITVQRILSEVAGNARRLTRNKKKFILQTLGTEEQKEDAI